MCILIRRCGWKQLHVCLLFFNLVFNKYKKGVEHYSHCNDYNLLRSACVIVKRNYVPHLVAESVYLTEHFQGTKLLEF